MLSSAGSASGSRREGGRRFTPVGAVPGWTAALREGAAAMGLTLPAGAEEGFKRYATLLQHWGRRVNLTSRLEPEEILSRHFLDSLVLLAAAPPSPGERLIDLGSGGGFPGIPLALARPDLHVTLLEPSLRRVLFLRTAVHDLGLEMVDVVRRRAGEAGTPPAGMVVCRAVAPLKELLSLSGPLLVPGGLLAAWKGPGEETGSLLPGWRLEGRWSVGVPGRPTPRELLLFRHH